MDRAEEVFAGFKRGACPLAFAASVWSANIDGLYAERHPLGFIKIELTPLTERRSLSLHLWTNTGRTPIHSHHFDMESLVFRGALLDTEFEIEQDDGSALVMLDLTYDANEANRRFSQRDGRYAAHAVRTRLAAATSYGVTKGVFHSTRSIVSGTAIVIMRRNVGTTGSGCLAAPTGVAAAQKEQRLSQSDVLTILDRSGAPDA